MPVVSARCAARRRARGKGIVASAERNSEHGSDARGVPAHVLVRSGFYEGLEWPLDRETTVIGRGRNADLVLSESTISRTHAVFGYEEGRLYLQDLGSTNGTLLNGVRQVRGFLSDGDEIHMGKLVLRIRIESTGGELRA
jgi:pSer/pThr/pTyr-binding forkhead associated (FHA) protein